MSPAKPYEFTASRLLIFEGKSDVGVFQQIARKKNLADIDFHFPHDKSNPASGGGKQGESK